MRGSLVLRRHVGEKVILRTPEGYMISVQLVAVFREGARLFFQAEREVEINREEVDIEKQKILGGKE